MLTKSAILLNAAWAATGGSTVIMKSLGGSLRSTTLYLSEGLSSILRKTVEVTSSAPAPSTSAPNGYTQQRVSLFFKFPKLLGNGNYTTNTMRIDMRYDPETTDAEIAEMRSLLPVVGAHENFDELISRGSTAA